MLLAEVADVWRQRRATRVDGAEINVLAPLIMAGTIFSGTSEVQRNIRKLLGAAELIPSAINVFGE
jgi:hypothetical protein